MSELCPRCKQYYCTLLFGVDQDDGTSICYDCHCEEMERLEYQ